MKSGHQVNIDQIWRNYLLNRDLELRDILVEHYLYLVRKITNQLVAGMPPHVQKSDLYSSGLNGLIRAIERFDHHKSKDFLKYASFLIKASIIDDIRKNAWVPRSVYYRIQKLSDAKDVLQKRLNKEPSDEDLCQYLQISSKELQQWFVSIRPALVVSLNESLLGDDVNGMPLVDCIADERSPTPFDIIDRRECIQMLSKALDSLDPREKQVMSLYYYERLSLKEIGAHLNITESRVCQIHSKSLFKLRATLQKVL